jgi:TRAP-type C4-dicarboxylate transport system substrate-binding protein
MLKSCLASFCASAALVSGAPAAAQQPLVLTLSSPAPPPSFPHSQVFTPWAEEVSTASNGTLTVQTFYGGALGDFAVTYDRVVAGVADIGFLLARLAHGRFRQQGVAGLPFEAPSALAASAAMWNLYEQGVTAAEFDAVKPLAVWVFPNAVIHSKDPVRSLADMKGRKLAAASPVLARVIATLGGMPVTLQPDEAYQALSRGIADGVLLDYTGMATFKLQELARHHVDVPLGAEPALLVINRKRYDSLPPPARAAIDRYSYSGLSQRLGRAADAEGDEKRVLVMNRLVVLHPEEEERWKRAVAAVAEEWARDTPDGANVLASFRKEIRALAAKRK